MRGGGGFCEPGQRPSPVLQVKPCSPSPARPGLRAGPAACATLPPTCVPEPRLPNTPYSAALISNEHPQDMTPGTPHTRSCWAATLSKLAQPTLFVFPRCFSKYLPSLTTCQALTPHLHTPAIYSSARQILQQPAQMCLEETTPLASGPSFLWVPTASATLCLGGHPGPHQVTLTARAVSYASVSPEPSSDPAP